jgi:signal recognition particle subunit SRP19
MVSRGESKLVVWPAYFDSSLTREQGRRVPIRYAVEKPTCDDLALAAKALKFQVVVEKEAAYPATPWKRDGRLILVKTGPKTAVLRKLGERLRVVKEEKL